MSGEMLFGIPWFGPPTGFDEPDPLIWWVAGPIIAYVWALYTALIIAHIINTRPPGKEVSQ